MQSIPTTKKKVRAEHRLLAQGDKNVSRPKQRTILQTELTAESTSLQQQLSIWETFSGQGGNFEQVNFPDSRAISEGTFNFAVTVYELSAHVTWRRICQTSTFSLLFMMDYGA